MSPVRVDVRAATQSDRPAIEIVRRQAIEASFSETYERNNFADLVARPETDLPDWIAADDVTVLVAETTVTIVGFGAFDETAGEILALYVSPDYQELGAGRRLINGLFEQVETATFERIRVVTPRPAVGFFEAVGFSPEAVTDEPPVEMVVMTVSADRLGS